MEHEEIVRYLINKGLDRHVITRWSEEKLRLKYSLIIEKEYETKN